MREPKLWQLNVRTSRELFWQIRKLAAAERRPTTAWIRNALEDRVQQEQQRPGHKGRESATA